MFYLALNMQTLPLNEVHQKIVTKNVIRHRRNVIFWEIRTVTVL
jgi:hypothetical protein